MKIYFKTNGFMTSTDYIVLLEQMIAAYTSALNNFSSMRIELIEESFETKDQVGSSYDVLPEGRLNISLRTSKSYDKNGTIISKPSPTEVFYAVKSVIDLAVLELNP